jgi:hypothetical protein
MNRLAIDRRVAVIAALVEGASINATVRMTGVAKHTVLKAAQFRQGAESAGQQRF